MAGVKRESLPPGTLLGRYDNAALEGGAPAATYTDCYTLNIGGSVSLESFVRAFYCTWLFRMERMILGALAGKPSTDADVSAIASGDTDRFAAWTVEDRSDNELLMCDVRGRTRSWFMVTPAAPAGTQLWFGSAVLFGSAAEPESASTDRVFRLLLGFHKLYSRALLGSAARLLATNRPDRTYS